MGNGKVEDIEFEDEGELEQLLNIDPKELDGIKVEKKGQYSLERIRQQLTDGFRPDVQIMLDWSRVGRYGKSTANGRVRDIAAGMAIVLGNEHYIKFMQWGKMLKRYQTKQARCEKVLDDATATEDAKAEARERLKEIREDVKVALVAIHQHSEHVNSCCKVMMQSEGTLAALPENSLPATPPNQSFQPGQQVGPGGTMVVAKEAHFHQPAAAAPASDAPAPG